ERLRIAGNGYVGIGTAAPQYLLDVAGVARISGTVYASDIRFKKNLAPISNPLENVLKLDGVSYEWKTDEFKEKGFPNGRHYGVIAQETEKILPDVVNTSADGTKTVAYTEIIPVLIEAIKEQQKIIEKQQKALEAQLSRIEKLEQQ
ncbi:MAG: tail fiber domain-containing protein, partial [Pelobacteraceae bacterium]